MGSSKFKEYKGLDLPAVNSEVLERWDAVDAFGKRHLDPRRGIRRSCFTRDLPRPTACRASTM